MDELDQAILTQLAANARVSVADLARALTTARSTIQARIERLERNGTIAGYTLRLSDTARASQIRATVLLSIDPQAQAGILTRLRALPAVASAVTTSGRFDLLLLIGAETTAALDRVLDDLGRIPGVRSSETLVHLATKIDRPA